MIGPQEILRKVNKYNEKLRLCGDKTKEDVYKSKIEKYTTILQKGGAYVNKSKINKYLYSQDGSVINNGQEYVITMIRSDDPVEMYFFGKMLEDTITTKTLRANSLNNSVSSNFFSKTLNKIIERIGPAFSGEGYPIESINADLMYHLSHYANVNNPIQHSYTFLYDEDINIMSKYRKKTIILNKSIADTFNYERIKTKNPNPYNIEHITFTGGGAKGIIYVGTLLALLISGLLVYINKFTGTSAGAMTACICGCITPKRKIYEEIRGLKLSDIDQNHNQIIRRYYLCVSYITNKLYNANMEELMGKLHVFSAKSTLENLQTIGALFNPDTKFIPWYIDMCKTICKIMDNDLYKYITEDNLFTFEEYSIATGKSLVIVATNVNDQSTMYFSSKNSPDINVIDTIKASMAIPIAFPAQSITGSGVRLEDGLLYNNEEIVSTYIDGGIYDNYALNNSDYRDRNGNILRHDNKQLGFFLTTEKTPYELYREVASLYVRINDVITNTAIITREDATRIISESGITETRTKIKNKYIGREYLKDTKVKVDKLCEKIVVIANEKGDTETVKKIFAAKQKIHATIAKLLKQKIYHPKIDIPDSHKLTEEDIYERRVRFLKYYLREEIRDETDYDVFDHISYSYNNEYVEAELNLFHVNIKELYDITHECIISQRCDNVEIYSAILNDIITLRNPIFIIFKECWKSVGYAEDSNNYYFGYATNEKDRYRYYGTYALTVKHLEDLITESIKGLSYIEDVLKTYTFKFTTGDIINLSINTVKGIGTLIQKLNDKKKLLQSLILDTTISDDEFRNMLKVDYIDITAKFFKKTVIDTTMSVYGKITDAATIADRLLIVINDKAAMSIRNRLRTVSLNTFDIGTLEFSMSNEKKGMMIYEGYQKTIKRLSQILCLQDLTNKSISDGTTLSDQTF